MKKIILFLLLCLPLSSFGQDLYLRMDNALPREYCSGWRIYSESPNIQYYQSYGYHTIFSVVPLGFICDDKATLSQVRPASALQEYPCKTLEQFEAMMAGKSKNQILDYLFALQNIYIIVTLPNGDIEISKVKPTNRNL